MIITFWIKLFNLTCKEKNHGTDPIPWSVFWCGLPDLNRYGLPHAPQTCASAYSAKAANRCLRFGTSIVYPFNMCLSTPFFSFLSIICFAYDNVLMYRKRKCLNSITGSYSAYHPALHKAVPVCLNCQALYPTEIPFPYHSSDCLSCLSLPVL